MEATPTFNITVYYTNYGVRQYKTFSGNDLRKIQDEAFEEIKKHGSCGVKEENVPPNKRIGSRSWKIYRTKLKKLLTH